MGHWHAVFTMIKREQNINVSITAVLKMSKSVKFTHWYVDKIRKKRKKMKLMQS